MAIGQSDFYLIPIRQPLRNGIDREKETNISFMNIDTKSLDPFLKGLAAAPSWSEDLKIFGDMETNRIDVEVKDKNIESIFLRFDKNDLDLNFIKKAILIAQKFNLIFLCEKNELVQSNKEKLIEAIKRPN